MNVYCIASLCSFIQNAIAYIDVKGELTFDLYPSNLNVLNNVTGNKIGIENGIIHQKRRALNETSAGTSANSTDKKRARIAEDDCVYRHPDGKAVDALLSNMMNQLTKIFIRTYDYVGRREARRTEKRFKIVRPTFDSTFFEQAYNSMSEEYRESINATNDISRLVSHDPCHHQVELKEFWRNLLERSKTILRLAAVRCVSDFLRVRNRADDTRTKEKVGELLLRELKEVRSNQLKVLCDNLKLCYKDLLYEGNQ